MPAINCPRRDAVKIGRHPKALKYLINDRTKSREKTIVGSFERLRRGFRPREDERAVHAKNIRRGYNTGEVRVLLENSSLRNTIIEVITNGIIAA